MRSFMGVYIYIYTHPSIVWANISQYSLLNNISGNIILKNIIILF